MEINTETSFFQIQREEGIEENKYLPLNDDMDDKWEQLDDMIPAEEFMKKENKIEEENHEETKEEDKVEEQNEIKE